MSSTEAADLAEIVAERLSNRVLSLRTVELAQVTTLTLNSEA